MKVVSKRAPGARALDDAARLQRTLNRLRGRGLVPRGLYRFSSFEEADRWMMSQIGGLGGQQGAVFNSHTPAVAKDISERLFGSVVVVPLSTIGDEIRLRIRTNEVRAEEPPSPYCRESAKCRRPGWPVSSVLGSSPSEHAGRIGGFPYDERAPRRLP